MYFEIGGVVDTTAPTVVLSSGLGGSAKFWKQQAAVLGQHFRVLTYDHLGTGRSTFLLPDEYSISDMAAELQTLLAEQHISQCHFIGHALGGLVGLQIALEQPQLLQSLLLVNAWGQPNRHSLRCFEIRKALLKAHEYEAYLQMQSVILYPPDWIVANDDWLMEEEQHLLLHFPNLSNLLVRINALSEFNISTELSRIPTRTFVVASKDDILVPWQQSQQLAEQLPNAELALMDYGGHACTITATAEFNKLMMKFLGH